MTSDMWYTAIDNKQTEPAILVNYERNHHGSGLLKLTVVHVFYAGGLIRNFDDSLYRDPNQYSGLTAVKYLSNDSLYPFSCCGGFDVEYRERFSADLRQLEAMLKTLRRVTKSLAKMQEELGDTDSHGEFLRRFAKAVGAKWVICEKPNSQNRGWSYDENKDNHRWLSPIEAKDHLNWIVRDHYPAKCGVESA